MGEISNTCCILMLKFKWTLHPYPSFDERLTKNLLGASLWWNFYLYHITFPFSWCEISIFTTYNDSISVVYYTDVKFLTLILTIFPFLLFTIFPFLLCTCISVIFFLYHMQYLNCTYPFYFYHIQRFPIVYYVQWISIFTTYNVSQSVVVSRIGIKGTKLHPSQTEFFCCVIKEATDVRTNL